MAVVPEFPESLYEVLLTRRSVVNITLEEDEKVRKLEQVTQEINDYAERLKKSAEDILDWVEDHIAKNNSSYKSGLVRTYHE